MGFLKDERGGLLPFTVVVAGIIILMGALAVNTVRVEHKRSVTQSILDICVLNAAAQRQTLEPRTAFDDCLEKHDFDATITSFVATTGRTKSVTASAATSVESFFLEETKTYAVAAGSSATETLSNLEIVLALDVSNSLNLPTSLSQRPLDDLKAAAKTFVSTMLAEDTQGRVHITIVPYSTQVNLGSELAAAFNVTNAPANLVDSTGVRIGPDVTEKRCLELPASSFNSIALSPTEPLAALPFVDVAGSTTQSNAYTAPNNANFAVAALQSNRCSFFRLAPSPSTSNVVRLPDFSAAGAQSTVDTVEERIVALHAKIDGLQSTGETSINLGMRWALAFLDPAMRPVFRAFSQAGRMSPLAASLPLDYTDPTSIKVIVLMSDGTNSTEQRVRDIYTQGMSPFWIGNDGNISWHNPLRSGADKYWVPHLPAPTGSPTGTAPGRWQATPWQNATNTGAPARQMTYDEVWRRMKVTYVAWQFHARSVSQASGGTAARSAANLAALNEYRPPALDITSTIKDNQLKSSCDLARDRGIYVYSLMFQTVTTTNATLEACAKTPSMAYTATSANLAQAFAAIALHISMLRLDQ